MDAKKTMVTLEVEGVTKAFLIEEAETLLRMRPNGGWKLSEKETKFIWTDEGFKPRKDKGGDKVSK